MSSAAAPVTKNLESIKEQDENSATKKSDAKPGQWVFQFLAHDPLQPKLTALPCANATKDQRTGWFPAEIYQLINKVKTSSNISSIDFLRFLKIDTNPITEVNIEALLIFNVSTFKTAKPDFNQKILNNLGTEDGNVLQFSFRDAEGKLRHDEIFNIFYYLEYVGAIQANNETRKLYDLIDHALFLEYKSNVLANKTVALETENKALRKDLEKLRSEFQALMLAVSPLLSGNVVTHTATTGSPTTITAVTSTNPPNTTPLVYSVGGTEATTGSAVTRSSSAAAISAFAKK